MRVAALRRNTDKEPRTLHTPNASEFRPHPAQDEVLVRVAALLCITLLLAVALASVLRRNSGSQAGVPDAETMRQALVPPGASARDS